MPWGGVGEREKNLALFASEEADFLVLVFDAIQGIKKTSRSCSRSYPL